MKATIKLLTLKERFLAGNFHFCTFIYSFKKKIVARKEVRTARTRGRPCSAVRALVKNLKKVNLFCSPRTAYGGQVEKKQKENARPQRKCTPWATHGGHLDP